MFGVRSGRSRLVADSMWQMVIGREAGNQNAKFLIWPELHDP